VRHRIRFLQRQRKPASPSRDARLVLCGGDEIWWTVEAETEADALQLLPFYVAQRTTVTRVGEVEIP
jgi:hypothetical protein